MTRNNPGITPFYSGFNGGELVSGPGTALVVEAQNRVDSSEEVAQNRVDSSGRVAQAGAGDGQRWPRQEQVTGRGGPRRVEEAGRCPKTG